MTGKIINNKKAFWLGIVVLVAVTAILISMVMAKPASDGKEVSLKDAGELYSHKIEDINDTALIADLFEEMKLEEIVGEYTVEISQEGDTLVLAVNALDAVRADGKKAFDGNMEICAQQMLALIPQVGRVQWTYQVVNAESKEEAAVGSFSRVDFESKLGKAPEHFGKSEEGIKELLEKQKTL